MTSALEYLGRLTDRLFETHMRRVAYTISTHTQFFSLHSA
jgi:hypothetical protein